MLTAGSHVCGTDTVSVQWASPSGLGFGFWWALPRKSDMFGEMMWPFYLDGWHWARSGGDLWLVGPGPSDNEELPFVCWSWVICSGLNKRSWCWQPDSHVNLPYGNLREAGWDWLEWLKVVFSRWKATQTKLSGLLPELWFQPGAFLLSVASTKRRRRCDAWNQTETWRKAVEGGFIAAYS